MSDILRKHSIRLRKLLSDYLRKGQSSGQVDPDLDPDFAAAILFCVFDGFRILPVRDPKLDLKKSVKLLKTLITRFLTSPQ
jgi:hypothetical protein